MIRPLDAVVVLAALVLGSEAAAQSERTDATSPPAEARLSVTVEEPATPDPDLTARLVRLHRSERRMLILGAASTVVVLAGVYTVLHDTSCDTCGGRDAQDPLGFAMLAIGGIGFTYSHVRASVLGLRLGREFRDAGVRRLRVAPSLALALLPTLFGTPGAPVVLWAHTARVRRQLTRLGVTASRTAWMLAPRVDPRRGIVAASVYGAF